MFVAFHFKAIEFCVVVAAFVEKFALTLTSAILDDDIVVVAIEADEHLAVARYEQTIGVNGLIVNVILTVVAVVEIECALIVFALCSSGIAVVTNHPDSAVGEMNVVLTVGLDIVVDTG